MTHDKLYTSLSANTMPKLTNQFQRTRHITSSPDKHYSLDSEDDFRSGCRNVSHQQQFFSELPSPDHTLRTADTPGFKPFTMSYSHWLRKRCDLEQKIVRFGNKTHR